MVGLYPLSPALLDERDLTWLVELADTSYVKNSAKELLERALRGEIALWKVLGEGAEGILATEVIETKSGKTLWIEGVAGIGIGRVYDKGWAALERLAKLHGAKAVSGQVSRPAMQRFYKRSGAKTAATVFTKELD